MMLSRARRVLIYRLGSLGDTVVALPALRLVERSFPDAARILLTNMPTHSNAPAAYAVLEGSGLIHGYIDYPWKMRRLRELVPLWWKIVRFRPQVVVYLMGTRKTDKRDAWFFRLCGVRRIIGISKRAASDSLYDPGKGLWEREGARLLRCIRELGTAEVDDLANWDLRLTEAEQRRAEAELATTVGYPIVACGPGTKMQAKDWGRENWRVLLTRLSRQLPGHALVLVGAKEDAEAADYAAVEWGGPVINLCGRLTPRETAAALRRAELFLGPDSGPMHLAAAYGVPCAIPFAALDRPGRWFPIGNSHRPIYHHVDCENCRLTVCIEQRKKCLTSITVDEMLAAALEAWREGQRARPS
ncbi:MAG: glycosyltransferase family 9 protein [Acidobacteriaceae bacterium]